MDIIILISITFHIGFLALHIYNPK